MLLIGCTDVAQAIDCYAGCPVLQPGAAEEYHSVTLIHEYEILNSSEGGLRQSWLEQFDGVP